MSLSYLRPAPGPLSYDTLERFAKVAGSDAFFNFEYGPEYTPIELSLTVFIPSGHGAVFAGGIFWNDEQAAETADSMRHGLNQPLFGIKCPSTSDNIAWTTGPSDDTGAFFNASAHIGSNAKLA